MNYVLDSSAIIAYLWAEPGGKIVLNLLKSGGDCFAHVLNLCEVYYHLRRLTSRVDSDTTIENLIQDGLRVRSDIDDAFWRQVGEHKIRGRISIADCFCIALAQRLGATVVTSDRHEFEPIEQAGIVPVLFIR